MSEEWRAEHPRHLLYVADCPYCRSRLAASAEGDPPQRVADFCTVHGEENCTAPDCYACGNHQMDVRGRCGDPRCGSLNTPEVIALLADMKDAPIELKRYMIGMYLTAALEDFHFAPIEQIIRDRVAKRLALGEGHISN